jgi:hypothetical protein
MPPVLLYFSQVRPMKQFNIHVQDEVGTLARLCEALSTINIRSISTEIRGDGNAVIRLVTTDDIGTKNALLNKDLKFNEEEIFVLDALDKPGELAKLTKLIADSGVDIRSFYLLDRGLFVLNVEEKDRNNVREIFSDRLVTK